MKVQRSAEYGSSPKKDAYIPKINDNKFDNAQSIHIIGNVVRFIDSLSLNRGTANRSGINAKQNRNNRGVRISVSIDCRHYGARVINTLNFTSPSA